MPAILDRLVKQLRAKGHSKDSAYAIATSVSYTHLTLPTPPYV